MKIHQSITLQRVFEAAKRHRASLDDPGFCVACGKEAEGVEPDARNYLCESCGDFTVYGAEDLFLCLQ
jgi:predicted RNA-binding Zn-ribbon protein involved in translation (DUF1610 family)